VGAACSYEPEGFGVPYPAFLIENGQGTGPEAIVIKGIWQEKKKKKKPNYSKAFRYR